jgi:hypothetical protein
MERVCNAAEGDVGFVRSAFVTLLAAILAGLACAADASGVKRSAEEFYEAYRKVEPSGVPTGKDLARYRPVVSRDLFALLERAGAAEEAYAKKTKNESPPLVEGDLFTSLFEGASRYHVEDCQAGTKAGTCHAALTYVDPSGGKSQEWRDTLYLVREDGGWRVNDIEYGGTWEFMHKGRLVDVLESVIKDSKRP